MTTEQLLQDLRTLTHADRVGAMIDLGRKGDAESRSIISAMESGGFYERALAIYSCFGSHDAGHILRAVNDHSRLLRGLAARLVALVCDDAEALEALRSAPPGARPVLVRRLRKQRRYAVIDTHVEQLNSDGDRDFAALLPFASAEQATRLATRFAEEASPVAWRHLAHLHPALTSSLLERQITEAAERDGRLIARVNALLPVLAGAEPDRALALAVALRDHGVPLSMIRVERLVEKRPSAVVNLALSERPTNTSILNQVARKYLYRLSSGEIIALIGSLPNVNIAWYNSWFTRLEPQRRAEVFAAIERRLRRGELVPTDIVAALPHVERIREARKYTALPRLRTAARLPYAAYLPWDEVTTVVDPYLHAAEALSRQAALSAVIRAVAFHRDHLGDVLAELRERRTEQDGTRQVMLRSLLSLPAGIWQDAHLADLEEIIRHGLNDVGLSAPTTQQIVALLLKLAPRFPDWASIQLNGVWRERGWTAPPGVFKVLALPPDIEMHLARVLVPLLELWAARDDESKILESVNSLVTRPAAFALVLGSIDEIVRRTRTRRHAESALRLLYERAFPHFRELVPALVAADRSWITFTPISQYLLRYRQDLLTPFLDYQAYSGRWGTGRRRFLLPMTTSFSGGTPEQQQRLADAALSIVADSAQESHMTTNAVKVLAYLPAISSAPLASLADDPRPLVRTTALFALARLDTPDGLPTLLAALQDARARTAIHAVRRYLLEMPTREALAVMHNVPLDRVTVAKEVIRLVGDLAPDRAFDELLALDARDLHRDVRVALLRTLGNYLDRPESWGILEREAHSPDRELALAPLSLSPLLKGKLLAYREDLSIQRHTLRLIAAILAHQEAAVRMEALRYCATLGIPDDERVLVPELVGRVREGLRGVRSRAAYDEVLASAEALFGVCTSEDVDGVVETVRNLKSERRLLQKALTSLGTIPRLRERSLLPVIRSVLAALADDPLTGQVRVELAVAQLPAEELVVFFWELSQSGALYADALVSAAKLLKGTNSRLDSAQLEMLEGDLQRSEDERLRRLGIEVLQARATKAGSWGGGLLARLREYRSDRSILVASAAQFTFPMGDELEEGESGGNDD